MSCNWKEEQAYSYAEGSMEPEQKAAFDRHLGGCALCRDRVAEAEDLESLLRGGIAPLAAPATLEARVANAVVLEREWRRSFSLSGLLGHRRWLQAAVAFALALTMVVLLVGPGAVTAVVQRALVFIPGLGIRAVDDGYLVATGPSSAQQGGATFSVDALLSDGKQTSVEFRVTGLPGGKMGWDREQNAKPAAPYLRDPAGRRYSALGYFSAVGGSPQENQLKGSMNFPLLPSDLRSVEMVVPVNYLVPPSVLPGADGKEWVAKISLAPAGQSGLPQANPQTASSTVQGIALRAAATRAESDSTVVLMEADARDGATVLNLFGQGREPSQAVTLRDNLGRGYPLNVEKSGSFVSWVPFRQDLYFQPLGLSAKQLTLEVARVLIQEEGEASFVVPLEGRRLGESFPLDRTVTLGSHQLRLKSATLVEEPQRPRQVGDDGGKPQPAPAIQVGEGGQRWLYIDVDLGETEGGRTFSSFRSETGGSWMSSMGKGSGTQMDRFGVEVQPDARDVTVRIAAPMVTVEGPWVLTFPAGSK